MAGLDGKSSSYLANKLAEKYNVDKSRIYKITEEVRPKRKPRSDKGKRKLDYTECVFYEYASQIILTELASPEEAFEKAKEKGFIPSKSFATFKRHLKEDGVWKTTKTLKTNKVVKETPIIVVLDEDVAKVFKDSETVNTVLRNLLTITKPN